MTIKFDYISDQTKMLKKLLHQKKNIDHIASYVHHPLLDYIETPSYELVFAQENNVGGKFIEISSNKGLILGYDKVNSLRWLQLIHKGKLIT